MASGRSRAPALCDFCGRKFSHVRDVQRHVENIHLNMPQITCHVCQQVFPNLEMWGEHISTHAPQTGFIETSSTFDGNVVELSRLFVESDIDVAFGEAIQTEIMEEIKYRARRSRVI